LQIDCIYFRNAPNLMEASGSHERAARRAESFAGL
jgi:hypothetical protein